MEPFHPNDQKLGNDLNYKVDRQCSNSLYNNNNKITIIIYCSRQFTEHRVQIVIGVTVQYRH